jgi:predicted RNA-binding protein with PUA-like domain
MPNYWILKTEPSTYSFDDLQREHRTTWDGISNPVALKHLRSMREGDQAMIYHTGDEKAIIGLAKVAGAPRPDSKDPRLVVVDLVAGDRLPHSVTLASIKADPSFADLGLVRMGRLSVVPATSAQWKHLLEMAAG